MCVCVSDCLFVCLFFPFIFISLLLFPFSLLTGGNKYIVDTTFLNVARSNMEIQSYMKDGMIDNWELFEKVLDYTYAKIIQSESQYHPVLFSECSWNVRSNRERLTELLFEKYNVPAFFVVKNAVLAAFANGRSTALVVDSGATHTSAVPVHVSPFAFRSIFIDCDFNSMSIFNCRRDTF